MRTIAILTVIIGLSITNTYAQEISEEGARKEMTPEQRADKRTSMMTEKLGLTAEQEDEIKAINREHAMEMEKIHEEMKALKESAKKEREKTKSEIESVLDDEQKSTFEEEVKKHKEERRKKRKERCCHEKE